jgi:ubiquinone/menaquinone biosynthesis C-methylase UbiE
MEPKTRGNQSSQDPGTPDTPAGPAERVPSAIGSARVKQHARSRFEKWALSYDRSLLNELVFFPSVRACQEEIIRWKANREPTPFRVLDVGCGTGSLLALLAEDERAELLVGVDYANEMVRRAADKFADSDYAEKLRALRGDAERLPLSSDSFDVVTCCNSFHHYPHQTEAVREFRRVLRPGGLLVLVDGFRDNVVGWVVFDVGVALYERHVHHASWSELREMISGAGFDDLRQRKMNVLAPLLINAARVRSELRA